MTRQGGLGHRRGVHAPDTESRRPLHAHAALLAAAALAVACFGPLGCTKKPVYRAALDDAHGIEPGAPAFAAGVRVGSVRSVKVEGDKAVVTFELSKENHLAFHADACATAMPIHEKGALYVQLGTQGSLDKGTALPECDLLPKAVRSTVSQIGKVFKGALDAFAKNARPLPPAQAPCAKVSVRIARVGSAPPAMGELHPRLTVQLEIDNASNASVSFPGGDAAGFLDAKHDALEVDTSAGADGWFMPFTVPAHGKHAVTVVFTDAAAKPVSLNVDLGYGMLQSCRLEARLAGP